MSPPWLVSPGVVRPPPSDATALCCVDVLAPQRRLRIFFFDFALYKCSHYILSFNLHDAQSSANEIRWQAYSSWELRVWLHLKVGRQTGVMTNGGACAPVHGLAGVSAGAGRPLPQRGFRGITPSKFRNFYVQNEAFGGKIALCFELLIPSKLQVWPKLLVTNGYLKVRNLMESFIHHKFAVMHCTLKNPHTMPHTHTLR